MLHCCRSSATFILVGAMLQLLHYIVVGTVLHISLREQCYIYNCWSYVTITTLYHCTSSAAFTFTFIIVGAMLQLLLYIVLGAVLHLSLSADICFAATLHCIVDVGDLQMGMMSIIRTR